MDRGQVAISMLECPAMSPELSTVEVSRITKIPRTTLQNWIRTGKIDAPRVKLVDGKAMRLWSSAQIEQARKLKGTFKPGPKKK